MPREESGQSTSAWMVDESRPPLTPLLQDETADVCIIGAGIAGMTTAYLLTQEGKSVVVLDDGRVAGGQTERTTAHLSNAIDDRYTEIERLHGKEGARLAAESHTEAIRRIEAIVAKEQIDCDFERLDGYLFLPPGESTKVLEDEIAAAHRAGLTGVKWSERAPLASFETGLCLRFPDQGQFHPLKYLEGLTRAVRRDGGRIYTGSHAEAIEGGSTVLIPTTAGPSVRALAVVIATNTPINDMVAIHTKQAPYRSYAIAASVPRGSVATALYWDTLDPYHYVRLEKKGTLADHDLLIVGGEDHKTGQAHDHAERYARLEEWARARFPAMKEVSFRWSGQVMETVDGLAFIGPNPLDEKNVFIVTGDSGMGMTHGTIAGILLTDLIKGRANPWAKLYDPSRKTIGAAGEFAKENLNVAKQYTDWLTGGEVKSPEEIPPGSGAVMRRGLKKVAIYRDENKVVHECSAVCPHLGCIVDWNDGEKTWDCPCHGSRFDCTGKVIDGPANSDLAPHG